VNRLRGRVVSGPVSFLAVVVAAVLAVVLGAVLAAGLGTSDASAQVKPDPQRLRDRSVPVKAEVLSAFDRINPFRKTFGSLEWIGGLRLKSDHASFGGWSGIAMDPDGRSFFAVSDAGTWMRGALDYKDGRPVGMGSVRLGPLRALSGKNLGRDRDRDAEAVALISGTSQDGQLAIAFEQNHRIGRFRASSSGLSAPSSYVRPSRSGQRMSSLRGFEAMAVLNGGPYRGSILAIAERRFTKNGNHSGWIWVRGRARDFELTDIGGYDVTDAAALPDLGLLVLERRFRWLEGVKMRVRYIPEHELRVGRVVRGEVLMEADMSQIIDNMEALGVHREESGAFILTLMSDDNFNALLQQNLLLQFRWRPPDARAGLN